MVDERTPDEIRVDAFIEKAKRQMNSLPIAIDLNGEDYSSCKMVDLSSYSVRGDGDEAPPLGQGFGTQGMNILCANADIYHVDLEVYAGLVQDGCDPVRLIGFYQRFGFVLQNEGKWREEGVERPYLIRRYNVRPT